MAKLKVLTKAQADKLVKVCESLLDPGEFMDPLYALAVGKFEDRTDDTELARENLNEFLADVENIRVVAKELGLL